LVGNCAEELRKLEPGSINCCVTSPPYFGLRDYGHPGQLGLEKTPEEYVAKLVAVFREVRRVLREDGTLWLNIGDSYAGGGGHSPNAPSSATSKSGKYGKALKSGGIKPQGSIKPKDLIGIPWMLAFALRADGWYLRQDIIWHKPNPMPESVKDRCTKAHEYLFLLSKSEKYYFDSEAMQEPATARPPGNATPHKYTKAYEESNTEEHRTKAGLASIGARETRNRRSVWTIATKPYREAHFATFPPALVEPCVIAGCPEGGTVLDPFMGSGTTAMVALSKGRNAVGVELNEVYVPLILDRVRGLGDVRLPPGVIDFNEM
jgi:DNA modification methylase